MPRLVLAAYIDLRPIGAGGVELLRHRERVQHGRSGLSLVSIGAGYSSNNLQVWHYDGTSWTSYAASDLTYDGNYASFTVTGFSGYAVTGRGARAGDAGPLVGGRPGAARVRPAKTMIGEH